MAQPSSPSFDHVHARLNSDARKKALEEAARLEAQMREQPPAQAGSPLSAPLPGQTVVIPLTEAQVQSMQAAAATPAPLAVTTQGTAAPVTGARNLNLQAPPAYTGGSWKQEQSAESAARSANTVAESYRQQLLSGETQASRNTGEYGGKISRNEDPEREASEWWIGQGMGYANSAGEAALSRLTNGGQSRLNFHTDSDGNISGELDALVPIYDGKNTMVFTQVGGRSMQEDRWIGNAGLGQRWFPLATDDIDGKLMLGYNVFYDYDLTRNHQRGGAGVEARYDWARLAFNVYTPLSGWKASKDLDYYEERAAKGWDLRFEGYVPFYRYLAVKGAFSQWKGDQVGVFGHTKLEKDPHVWSYGVEYTPIPMLSAFLTHRQSQGGHDDLQVGLKYNWQFGMPWEDQVSPSKVMEMRSVTGNRYELVDRENKIILEYRIKAFNLSIAAGSFTGRPGDLVRIPLIVQSPAPITSMVWDGTAAAFYSGGSYSEGRFILPAYIEPVSTLGATPAKTFTDTSATASAAASATSFADPATDPNVYTARVTMTNDAGQTGTSQLVTITVLPPAQGVTITLRSDPEQITHLSTATVTATVLDDTTPLSGADITWSTIGSGSVTPGGATGSNGKASAVFTAGSISEVAIVTATLTSDPTVSASTSINVVSSYAIAIEVAETNPHTGDLLHVSATLTDNGVPQPGEQVEWSITPRSDAPVTGTMTTDANGKIEGTFTPTTPGPIGLETIWITDPTVRDAKTIEVTPQYSFSFSADNPAPGIGDTVNVTATLLDGLLPVEAANLTWVVTGNGTISGGTQTDVNGKATAALYITGTGTITLTVTTDTTPAFTGSYTIAIGSSRSLSITPLSSTMLTYGTQNLTATLLDGQVGLSGEAITWSVEPALGGSISGSTSTGAGGFATATLTAGSAAGTYTIHATLASDPTVTASATVMVHSAYALSLGASKTTPALNESISLTALLKDGNTPVGGQDIVWTVSPSAAGTIAAGPATDNNGQTSVSFASSQTGPVIITASTSDHSVSQSITLNVDSSYTLSLTAGTSTPSAGERVALLATLMNGNTPVSGITLIWSVNGAGAISSSTATNTSGQAMAYFDTGASGSVTITVSTSNPAPLSQTVTLNVSADYSLVLAGSSSLTAGDSSTYTATLMDGTMPVQDKSITWQVLGSGSITGGLATNPNGETTANFSTGLSGTVTLVASCANPAVSQRMDVTVAPHYTIELAGDRSPDAGDTVTYTVQVLDGNTPVSGKVINWSVAGSGSISATGGATDNMGYTTVTFVTGLSGSNTLTGSITSPAYSQSFGITVNSQYTISVSAAAGTVETNGTISLTATLLDGTTRVSGQALDWSVSPGSGGTMSGGTTTNANGQATASFTAGSTAGSVSITANLASTPSIRDSATVSVTNDYSLSLTPPNSSVGSNGEVTFSAVLLDGSTGVSGESLTWTVTPMTDGTLNSQPTTNVSGLATATFKAGSTAGTYTVTVSRTSDPALTASATVIVSNASALYTLTLTPTSGPHTAGDTINVTARLLNGVTPVAGAVIDWSASPLLGGSIVGSGTATNLDGETTISFVTGLSGTINLTATSMNPAISATAVLTVAANYNLTLSAGTTTPAAGATVPLTAILKDGNTPINGKLITWSVVSGSGNVTNGGATGSNGQSIASFATGLSGSVTLRAEFAEQSLSENLTLTVNPNYSLSLLAADLTPEAGAVVSIDAVLKDGNTPVSGKTVSWSTFPATAGSISTSPATDVDGKTTVNYTTGPSGNATVAAQVTDLSVNQTVILAVQPNYTLTLSADNNSPDAGDSVVFTATLMDGLTPVMGKTLSWSVAPLSGGTLQGGGTPTDSGGTTTVTLSTGLSGSATVTAHLADPSLTGQHTINVQPNYSLVLSSNNTTPLAGDVVSVTATLLDGTTPVSGKTLNWSLSPNNGSISGGASTNSIGQTTVSFATGLSGTVTVAASLSSSSVSDELDFVVTPNYSISLSTTNNTPQAGDTVTIIATLLDGNTPVPGKTITLTAPSESGGTVSGSDTTDGNGQTTFTYTTGQSGSVILTVSSSDPQAIQTITINVRANYSLSLTQSSPPQAGETVDVIATLKDGNIPLQGKTVTWSVIGSGSIVDGNATDATGQSTGRYTAGLSGSATLSAVSADPVVSGTLTLTIGSDYSLTLTPDNLNVAAGSTASIEALLEDGSLPLSGKNLQWSVSPAERGNILVGQATDNAGQATVTLEAGLSGTGTLTATSTDPAISQTANLTITPNYSMGFTTSNANPLAGDTVTVTATLLDGNTPVSGKTINWSVTAPGTVNSGDPTDANGQTTASFIAGPSGTYTLTASSSDLGITQTYAITVGAKYTLQLQATNNPVPAGSSTTLTATLLDGITPVNDVIITWSALPQNGGTFSAPSSTTNTSGIATVDYTTGLSGIVTATATSTTPALSQTLNLNVGANYSISLAPSNSNPQAGTAVDLVATLHDGTTPISDKTITWSVSPLSGGSLAPGGLTDSDGKTTAVLSTGLSGNTTVTATWQEGGISRSELINITPNYSLSVSPNAMDMLTYGSVNLTATLLDGTTEAASQAITWSVDPLTAGSFSGGTTTGPDGQATVIFTAGSTAGTFAITASLGSAPAVTTTTTVTVAHDYDFSITPGALTLDTYGTTDLTVTLLDGTTPVNNEAIDWTFTTSDGSSITGGGTTDASGHATAVFTAGGTDGSVTITASLHSDPTVFATATLALQHSYTLALSASDTIPQAGTTTTITATLLDNGVGVSNAVLTWASSNGGSFAASNPTDGNGQTTVVFTTGASGPVEVTATCADPAISQTIFLNVGGNFSLSLAVDNASPLAGGLVALTATLLDGGNPVSGATLAWSLAPNSGQLSQTDATTGDDGKIIVYLATGLSGNYTVTASGSATYDNVTQNITINVRPNYSLALSANTTPTAGDTITVDAILLDGTTPVPDVAINWSASPLSGGVFSSPSSTTGSDGKSTISFATGLSGSVTLTATSFRPAVSQTMTLTIGANYSLSLSTPETSPLAGETVAVTATIRDGTSPVSGRAVAWSIAGYGSISGAGATNLNGETTVSYLTGPSGPVTLTATADPDLSATLNLNVQARYSLVFTTSNPNPKAGDTVIITATVLDGTTPVSGEHIDWSLVGSGLVTGGDPTDANGQTTATFITGLSGSGVLTATSTDHPPLAATLNLTVSSNYNLSLSADSISPAAGSPATLTATLKDGNTPLSGKALTWRVAGSGTVGAGPVTNADGQTTARFNTGLSGLSIITAASADPAIEQHISLNVQPHYSLELSTNPANPRAGDTVSVTATLLDGTTPVSGQTIQWTTTGSGSLTPGDATDANGKTTATFVTGLSGSVTVTAALTSPGVSQTVTFTVSSNYSLAVSANTLTILSGNTVSVSATLLDGTTPVSGHAVTWSVSPATGGSVIAATPTDASGVATATYVTGLSGTITLTAATTAPALSKTLSITVQPNYSLVLSPDIANPQAGDTVQVTATLLDGITPVSDKAINWTRTGSGSIANGPVTNVNGQTTATYVTGLSGSVTLTATSTSPSINKALTLTVSPNYNLTLTPDNSTPAAGDTVNVVAVLKDGNTPLNGKTITWSIAGPGSVAQGSSTDSNGQTTGIFTSTRSGGVILTAACTDPAVSQTVDLTVQPRYSLSVVSSKPNPQAGDSFTLTATLLDGITPVSGKTINWSVSPLSGGTITAGDVTNDFGQATATLTAGRSGSIIVLASSNDPNVSQALPMIIAAKYSLTLSTSNPNPAAGDTVTLTAVLKDGNTPVSGKVITWSVSSSGSITPSGITDANGAVTVSYITGLSGAMTVTAACADPALSANLGLTVSANYSLTLSASKNNPQAGDTVTMTATLRDGNTPVSGKNFTWALTGSGNVGSSPATDANGQTRATFVTGLSGDVTLTATSSSPNINGTIALTVSANYSMTLIPVSSSLDAGGNVEVVAELKDGNTPVSGKTITWSVAGSGSVTPGQDTNISGQTTANFVSGLSGTVVLTASLGDPAVSQTVSLTVRPKYSLSLVSDPQTPRAGDTVQVTATLLDGNTPVSGKNISWAVTGSGSISNGSISNGPATAADGTTTATLVTGLSGSVTLTATGTDPVITSSITLAVAPNYALSIDPGTNNINTFGTVNLTATLVDGTTAAGDQAITWSVSPSTAGTFSGGTSTGAGGLATSTFTAGSTGGVFTVTATLASNNAITATATVTINHNYSLSLSTASTTPGAGDAMSIVATLLDNGVGVSNKTISWSLGSGSGTITPGAPTNASGQTTASFLTGASGTVTLTATSADPALVQTITIDVGASYSLTLTPDSTTPTAGGSVNIQALLKDGNTPLSDKTITWSVVVGSGTVTVSGVTDSNGVTTATFVTGLSGNVTITAASIDPAVSTSLALTVAANYSLTLSANTTTPNAGDTVNVTAVLMDGNTPVNNKIVTWSSGGAGVISGGGATDATGTTTISYATGESGSVTLTASITSPALSRTIALTINPLYTLSLSANVLNPAAGDTVTITAVLKDGNTPQSGKTINWSRLGSGTITSSSVTNASGMATATFVTGLSGSVTVTATSTSPAASQSLVLNVRANYNLTLTPSTTSPAAGSPVTVTAVLKDGNTPLSGKTITWSVSPASGGSVTAGAVTNSSGVTTATFETGLSGSITLTASCASPVVTQDLILNVSSNYTLTLTASTTAPAAGSNVTLSAVLKDGNTPVSGKTITWSVAGSGTVTLSSVTDATGKATATYVTGLSGNATLTASCASPSISQSIGLGVLANYTLNLTADNTSPAAGATVNITAVLKDGNTPVSGKTITWSIVGSGSITASGITDANGQTTAAFVTGLSGNVTITAACSVPVLSKSLALAVSANYNLTLAPGTTSPVAGSTVSIIATLKDGNTPIQGKTINWAAVGPGTITAGTVTNTNGQTTANYVTGLSGSVTITAQCLSPAVSQTLGLTVSPNYNLTLTPSTTSPAAGDTVTVNAVLKDGNTPISGKTITWSVTTGSGTVTAGLATDTNGQTTATFVTGLSGAVTLTASCASPVVSQTLNLTVNANYSLTLTAGTTTPAAGATVALTAVLKDGNTPLSGKTINFSVSGPGSIATTPVTTDINGTATTNYVTGLSGAVTVTAASTSPIISKTLALTVSSNYTLTLVASKSTLNAGETTTVLATLKDGNTPVSGKSITWSIQGSGSGSITAGALTNAAGQTTATFVTGLSGGVTLKATCASPTISQTTGLTVNPLYTLTLTPANSSPTAGGSTTVTALLKDGNTPVSGKTIAWSVTAGAGTITAGSSTNSSGLTTATFTTGVSGVVTLTAANTALGISSSVSLTVQSNYSLTLSSGNDDDDDDLKAGDTIIITATLKDGNTLISGQTINWSLVGSGTITPSGTTDANGQVKASYVTGLSGDITVTATLAGSSPVLSKSLNISVRSNYSLTLSANPTSPPAGTPAVITATLKDGNTAVVDKAITWSVSGSGTITAVTVTNASGQTTATFNAGLSGSVVLTAATSNPSLSKTISLTVAPNYKISLAAGSNTPDTGATVSLTATLLDGTLPLANKTVNWSIESGATAGITLNASSSASGSTGIASTTFKVTKAGTATLRATLASSPTVYATVTVTITPKYTISLSGIPTVGIKLLTSTTVTATVLDSGVPVAGATVNWSDGGLGLNLVTLTPSSSTTNANGQTTSTLRGVALGIITIKATLAGSSPPISAESGSIQILLL